MGIMGPTPEEKPKKTGFYVSMAIIGGAVAVMLIAGYLAFVPVKVAQPNVQPYPVRTQTLKAGDNMVYVADVCKFKSVVGNVTRTFVDEDGVRYPIPSQESNIAPGCAKNPVTVPTLPTLKPGKYYLTLDVHYQVNALRQQTYHFRTETFTIEANQ